MIPLLLAVFFAALLIRSRWIVWQVEQYVASTLYWAIMTKQPISVTKEMSEVWPAYQIFLRFWIWDFRCFVVNQGHYDAMQTFLLSELGREDRGWEIFRSDKPDFPLDKKPETKEDDTHGPN